MREGRERKREREEEREGREREREREREGGREREREGGGGEMPFFALPHCHLKSGTIHYTLSCKHVQMWPKNSVVFEKCAREKKKEHSNAIHGVHTLIPGPVE